MDKRVSKDYLEGAHQRIEGALENQDLGMKEICTRFNKYSER